MIRRGVAFIILAWIIGFVVFAITLPQPADDRVTDAIVVMTGAPGRIARGVELLNAGRAQRMLISGVDRGVKPRELIEKQNVPPQLLACCIDLGREAVDTRSNGAETAAWLVQHNYHSVRLVTSDWHMRRANLELQAVALPGLTVVADAVPGDAGFFGLLLEYNKFITRRAAVLVGL